MSRQACRILGLLAAALGARFDMYALYFLPIIFKITVITVQVHTHILLASLDHLYCNLAGRQLCLPVFCSEVTGSQSAVSHMMCSHLESGYPA